MTAFTPIVSGTPIAAPALSAQPRALVGVDVFVDHLGGVDQLAAKLSAVSTGLAAFSTIERIAGVGPLKCRFLAQPGKVLNKAVIAELMAALARAGVDFVRTEHLFTTDGITVGTVH